MHRETIVITGASRGIGAAAARRLARPDRHLVLLARNERMLARRADEIRARGGHATAVPVDLADATTVRSVFDHVERVCPRIGGLVLNAGVANDLRFEDADRGSMEREIEVNYLAPAELLRRVLAGMVARGSGRVVVVGSLTSFVPFPGNASYCASKSALFSLIRSVRLELKGSGVHFGVVLPGHTRTRMTERRQSLIPPMSAEAVGDAVARCYDQRKVLVIPGALNGVAARLFGAFPATSDRVLTRFSRFLIPELS